MTVAATLPIHLDAERLIARLGQLLGVSPATIVWEPGLVRGRHLLGYVRPTEPDRLHVDPAGRHVIETAAHEWIHSLEERGYVPRETVRIQGSRCSRLARRLGPAIAAAAAVSIDFAPLPDELLAITIGQRLPMPTGSLR